MQFTEENVRKRFHELRKDRETKMAKIQPLQDERDELVKKQTTEIQKVEAKLNKAREGLFELDSELGMLAKALNGRTGEAE